MNDQSKIKKYGIRAVAIFELLKGSLVLLATSILYFIKHPEMKNFGLTILAHVHPISVNNYLRDGINYFSIGGHKEFFTLAILYITLRFIEAYGLWFSKRWGIALGLFSVLIYLPFEFFEIYQHMTPAKIGITIINLCMIIYLQSFKKNRDESISLKETSDLDHPPKAFTNI